MTLPDDIELDNKILDLIEPHYLNINCTRADAKTSVTFRKFQELIAQEKAKWVAEAEKLEHYYSHKARKEAGYAELYWCACGKYDKDKDRLLRHVRWHELALAKLLDKENEK